MNPTYAIYFPEEETADKKALKEAYMRGYKQALKDTKERLRKLSDGAEMLTSCTTVSFSNMVDVTIPEELYKKLTE